MLKFREPDHQDFRIAGQPIGTPKPIFKSIPGSKLRSKNQFIEVTEAVEAPQVFSTLPCQETPYRPNIVSIWAEQAGQPASIRVSGVPHVSAFPFLSLLVRSCPPGLAHNRV